MQAAYYPLHILSRLVAVCLLALPLAWLHRVVDEFEREAIGKMTHQQLIAFVQENHSASFLGAYLQVAVVNLLFVAAVEALAFGMRYAVGLFAQNQSGNLREENWDRARTDFMSPENTGFRALSSGQIPK